MRKAYLLEALIFCFLTALGTVLYCFIIISLGAHFGLPSISLLPIHPGSTLPILVRDLGKSFLYLLLAFNLTYFLGLLLATINYRLNTWGRVIFWFLFGVPLLNIFIGFAEVSTEGVQLEDLNLPLYFISKPFLRLIFFANQGIGQLLLVYLAFLIIFIGLWAFLFQNMRIKYSKIDA